MATQSGTQNPAVESSHLDAILVWEPYRCNFFQAVRLLERLASHRDPVGRFGSPSAEAARFHAHASLDFPASEIQAITEGKLGQPQVTVNFMGLFGPLGVMPTAYTDFVMERVRQGDTAVAEFLDIFNHRIISLFYQVWEKYRAPVAYERGELDRFSHHLLDIVGLGGSGLQRRQQIADDSFMYYSGLLGPATRSAAVLEQVIADYFEVGVQVEQFIGAWYPLEEQDECHLGNESGPSAQLGVGAVVGDEIPDQQSRIRLRLGPLTMAQYLDLVPAAHRDDEHDVDPEEGAGWRELLAVTEFFTRREFEVEVQYVLRSEDVPDCELGDESPRAPRLGLTTWIKSRPFDRNPDETVLLLE